MEQKRRKIEKKKQGGKLEIEGGKVTNRGEDFFFFFFFFSLLFTFQNDWNLFWVYQNGNFLPGKSISGLEKIRKTDSPPPQRPCHWCVENIDNPYGLRITGKRHGLLAFGKGKVEIVAGYVWCVVGPIRRAR